MDQDFIRTLNLYLRELKSKLPVKDEVEDYLIRRTIKNILYLKNLSQQANTALVDAYSNLIQQKKFLSSNRNKLKLIRTFSKSKPIILDEEPPMIDLSLKEIYTLVHDFFKEVLDAKTFQKFLYIYNNRHEFIHFNRYGSFIVFLAYYNQPHIFIKNDDTIETYLSLCHEISHALIYFISLFFNDAFLGEVPSEFFEMLSLDFLKSIPEFQDLATEAITYAFNDDLRDAKQIMIQNELFTRSSTNPSLQEIKRILRTMAAKNKDPRTKYFYRFPELAYFSSREKYEYAVGQAIQQILFKQFYHDREKALHTLKQLVQINMSKPYPKIEKRLDQLGLIPTAETCKDYKRLIIKKNSVNFK